MKSVIISAFIFFSLTVIIWEYSASDDARLQIAMESYHQGEIATSISARKAAFNEALKNYLNLENAYQPALGTGKLYQNIGNTYFQLEEYPLALFYYRQAEILLPRATQVQRELATVKEKLQLEEKKNPIFPTYFSLPERLQLFFIFAAIAAISSSLYIWTSDIWMKRIRLISSTFTIILLVSLIYTRYFTPIEAVLIHASDLRKDAGLHYATVNNFPLPAGTEVEIIDVSKDGKWLKIVTTNGSFGFIPKDFLRVLEQ